MSRYIHLKCQCGTTLRVKEDLDGSVVRCWNCHEGVALPSRTGERMTIESVDSARGVFRSDLFLALCLFALATTLILAIPVAGGWLALLPLGLGGAWYRETAGRGEFGGDLGSIREAARDWRPLTVRWAWGLAVGLGLLAPFLVRQLVLGRVVHWSAVEGPAVAIAAVLSWIGVPMAVLATSAPDGSRPIGLGGALSAIRKHPLATLIILLGLPIGLAAIEAVIVAVTWYERWLPFLIADLFPPPSSAAHAPIPLQGFEQIDPSMPGAVFFRAYAQALARGFTFVGAIPASLSRGISPWINVPLSAQFTLMYWAIRFLLTACILVTSVTLLAIQARWLGLLPAGARRREPKAPRA